MSYLRKPRLFQSPEIVLNLKLMCCALRLLRDDQTLFTCNP